MNNSCSYHLAISLIVSFSAVLLQFASAGAAAQCGDSSSSNSGSKVSPILIGPAASSQPPPSGGGGSSGFLWWPIVASLGGAAMLACCTFLAVAAYRRRKKEKRRLSESGADDAAGPTDCPADEVARTAVGEERSLPLSPPHAAGWVKADDDPKSRKRAPPATAPSSAGSGISRSSSVVKGPAADAGSNVIGRAPDPSFPGSDTKPTVKKIAGTGNFFTNLFRKRPSRPNDEEADLEAGAGAVVVPTGLATSDSVMRSLQSQADAVVASKSKDLLRDAPLLRQQNSRVSSRSRVA